MIFLLVIIFCLLTYKFLSSWIWWLLPVAIVFDFGLWMIHHLAMTALLIAVGFGLYDKLIYQPKHSHSMFYDDSKASKPRHMKS